jgi:branched-chain amino acid transport system substrate-binding protein
MKRLVWLTVVSTLVATGCGTRLTQQEIVSSARAGLAPATASPATEAESGAAAGALDAAAVPVAGTDAGGDTAAAGDPGAGRPGNGVPERSTAAGPTRTGTAGTARTDTSGRAAGIGEARAGGEKATSSGAASKPGGSQATPAPTNPASKPPVLLASVGNYSGIIGAIYQPAAKTLQVWAQAVNSRGGVNGHPVRLVVVDDAGDPGRHRAVVQDLAERQRVVAFLGMFAPQSAPASVQYLNAKRVPVIGGSYQEAQWISSPMHFPQAAPFDQYWYGVAARIAEEMVPKAKPRFGTLICTESPACAEGGKQMKRFAGAVGLQLVYEGQASVAQPDFTAECLAARNARVDVIHFAMDAPSIKRFAASCARQNYHPISSAAITVVSPSDAGEEDLDGLLVAGMTYPWFLASIPAAAEFLDTMKRLAPGFEVNGVAAEAWVAAKLFERATTALPDDPTTSAVLDGLWAIQGDNLGGLTQPLTFRRDQPNAQARCWFPIALKDGKFISTTDGRANCAR